MKLRRQVFQYTLDVKARPFPRQAYVNIGDVMYDMLEMNNVFDELYSKSPAWPNMLRRVTVSEPGDSAFLPGEKVDARRYAEENRRLCPFCTCVLAGEFDYCPSCGHFVGEHLLLFQASVKSWPGLS